jgi:hypothetical protein
MTFDQRLKQFAELVVDPFEIREANCPPESRVLQKDEP